MPAAIDEQTRRNDHTEQQAMPAAALDAWRELDARVAGVRARHRAKFLTAGVLLALALFAAAFLGFSLADVLFKLTVGQRLFALCASLFGVLVVFAACVWRPWRRLGGPAHIARDVEHAYPELESQLSTAIEYGRDATLAERTSSPLLVGALIEQARERAKPLDFARTIRWRWVALAAVLAFVVAGGVGLYAKMEGRLFRTTWQRFLFPTADVAAPTLTVISSVEPADEEVEIGRSVAVNVAVDGREPESAVLRVQVGDPETGRWEERLMARGEDGQYHVTLRRLIEEVRYQVQAGDAESRVYTISVYRPPRIEAFHVLLDYPEYTRKPGEQLAEGSGDVKALRGTKVSVKLKGNGDLHGARAVFESGRDPADAVVDGRNGELTFSIDSDDRYQLEIVDTHGRTARGLTYRVQALEDARPKVRIMKPDRDLMVHVEQEVRVEIEATDDLGVGEIGIFHSMGLDEQKTMVRRLDPEHPETRAKGSLKWELGNLGLKGGEVIAYYAYALDNDTVGGPKMAKSDLHFLTVYDEEKYDSPDAPKDPQQQQPTPESLRSLDKMIDSQKSLLQATFGQARRREESKDEKPADQEVADAKKTSKAQRELKQNLRELIEEVQKEMERQAAEEQPEGADHPQALGEKELNEMRVAADKMEEAARKLDATEPTPAVRYESEALRHLSETRRLLLSDKEGDPRFKTAMNKQSKKNRKKKQSQEQQDRQQAQEQLSQLPKMMEREQELEREVERLEEPEEPQTADQQPPQPQEPQDAAQQEKQRTLERLQEEMKQLADQLADQKEKFGDLADRNQELKETAEHLDNAQKSLENAQKDLKDQKFNEAKQDLEQARRETEQAKRSGERALEKNLRQQLANLQRDAQDLARRQEDLAQQSREMQQQMQQEQGQQPQPGEQKQPGEQPQPGEQKQPGEQPQPGEQKQPGGEPQPGQQQPNGQPQPGEQQAASSSTSQQGKPSAQMQQQMGANARRQGEVGEDLKDLAEQLKALGERMGEQKLPGGKSLQDAQALAEEQAPGQRAAKKAEESLQAGNPQEAEHNQRRAADAMEAIARSVQEAAQKVQAGDMQKLAEAIKQAKELAGKQEQVGKDLAANREPAALADKEREIAKAANELGDAAERLEALRKQGRHAAAKEQLKEAGQKAQEAGKALDGQDKEQAKAPVEAAAAALEQAVSQMERAAGKSLKEQAKDAQDLADKTRQNQEAAAAAAREVPKPEGDKDLQGAAAEKRDEAADKQRQAANLAKRLEKAIEGLEEMAKDVNPSAAQTATQAKEKMKESRLPPNMERLAQDLAKIGDAKKAQEEPSRPAPQPKDAAKQGDELAEQVQGIQRALEQFQAEAEKDEAGILQALEERAREAAKQAKELSQKTDPKKEEGQKGEHGQPKPEPGNAKPPMEQAQALEQQLKNLEPSIQNLGEQAKEKENMNAAKQAMQQAMDEMRKLPPNADASQQQGQPRDVKAQTGGRPIERVNHEMQKMAGLLKDRRERILRAREVRTQEDQKVPKEYEDLAGRYTRALSEDTEDDK